MFLPPYRPDFNPIEKAFARLKAVLRKAGERIVSDLWSLIAKLVDLFQPQECANYFSSCGYDRIVGAANLFCTDQALGVSDPRRRSSA